MKHIWKKCLPEYYHAVRKRTKTFEIRKDDSDYKVGDILELQEWDGEKYTGHKIAREITYILRDCPEYGLAEGFCILAVQPIGWNETYYSTQEIHQTIVQCKSCKHWTKALGGQCNRLTVNGIAHCTSPDWFCGDGELKE